MIEPDPAQGGYRHVVKLKYENRLVSVVLRGIGDSQKANYQVGLVIFNPYTDNALETLCSNFELITEKATVVARSHKKHPYALRSGMALLLDNPVIGEGRHSVKPDNSQLFASGRRLPNGGVAGDTFAKYSWMSGDSKEDRDRIFAHVHVCSCFPILIHN